MGNKLIAIFELQEKQMYKSTWLSILQNVIFEAIAILLIVASGMETGNMISDCLLFLFYSMLLRLTWNSAIVIHGLGHTFAIAVIDQQLSILNLTNILEHRSIKTVFQSLLPFSNIFIPFLTTCSDFPYLAVGNSTQVRVKALGGILFNFLFVAITVFFHPSNLISQTFIVANLLIALSSLSDIDALVTGVADCFYCGNFGLIAHRQPDDGNELLPARIVEMAQIMGRETEIRGEQAGGGLVLARDEEQIVFVGKKVVKRKRDNLTQSLEAAFAPIRQKAIASDIKPLESLVIGAWHYRYATSGTAPSELETHWHEWMGARNENVWQFIDREWVCQTKNVNHRITHNGDFDAWELFGQEVDNLTLGLWLERILHTPNATEGDSPKIAGMMDLLITKGMWYASSRLAYQLAITQCLAVSEIANSLESAFPSVENLTSWTEIFESIFAELSHSPEPDSLYFPQYLNRLENNILQAISDQTIIAKWSESQRTAFVQTAIEAFFHNDLYRATQIFISRAKGSFGLVTVSTLEESQLVLAAKGQPITIGFNWQQKYMVYASEPAAVDRVLADVSGSSRLDLNPQAGEIAQVSAEDITIYSLKKQRELKASELENRWISLKHHPHLPYVKFSESENQDPVESDLQSIPRVLAEIKTSWQNSTSLNRQSADYLVHLLTEKVQRFEQKQQKMFQAGLMSQIRPTPTVDLLITGEENSLWLGERFAQNLKTVFPLLNVVTISANEVLQQLSQNLNQLCLNKNSLVLAITQSGQTFSTVQVIDTFDHLCDQGVIGELFILTGELSSFINSTQGNGGVTAILPSSFLDNPHRHRIFINGSGRRKAEPSTVTVAAAGQTLTELLFYLAQQMKNNFPDSEPFGMNLTSESLLVLAMMKDDFLNKNVRQIIGVTARGKPIKSAIRQKLVQGGRHWGLHVTETPLAWAIHAFYVFITVGWVIPFGETLPLVKTSLGLIFNLANLPQSLLEAVSPVITLADIAIYIFGSWFWTLLIRYFQGRQLLARMGKRTLVIGDVPWVNQLLQAYISKLFSLSYGIATIEVHGSNPQNHFLHAFGHRVVRGTLIFLGVPDGRRSKKLQEAENAVLMTGKQANGVRNINVGPEIVVMGHHDAAIADKGFSDAIILDSNDDAIYFRNSTVTEQKEQIEELRESCFGAFERLLASYVFFWALAKKVASFPLLKYEYWKSQSRTKIMTTASPVAGLNLSKLFHKNRLYRKIKFKKYTKNN
ncbi:conserved membrane hypothetical protein [Hyella patelloides LEGE 07179]|uniref:Glutamine amidotransferase type-2 domain-containing protein n=1 Tax=Hyella patelloides LEGE 07179 TaxID=945734 RepID=A0A563VSS5_9CYAN|nr:hypothetical protein [Hyella patelloides]VEP14270.1 conserved membrane hypothetical protein [Hyella patelloides LEGE 07179]VEP14437.1 conserved membrane hypothetical protein [Hyella patelloides LEGE 07179]